MNTQFKVPDDVTGGGASHATLVKGRGAGRAAFVMRVRLYAARRR